MSSADRVKRGGIYLGLLCVVLFLPPVHADERSCWRTSNRVCAATVRRAATEYANCFRRGSDCQPPEWMEEGRLSGGADDRTLAEIERVWRHTTYTKFRRHCRGVEYTFGGYCAEMPEDPEAITDCLFNEYILPWLGALDELTAELSPACRRELIDNAGRAARDYLRWGRDTWERLGRHVRHKCPELSRSDFALDRPSLWRDTCEATLTFIGPVHR